jgi:iron complex transport system substrate-binding protein
MRRLGLAIVLVALVGAACTSGDRETVVAAAATPTPGLPATFTGPDGVTSEITDVSRIVTLSGDFTEIIYELGLGDNIVGVDLTSTYPTEFVNTKPKIGVEYAVLAEPILALSPTIVIGDTDAVPQAAIDQVRSAGVPVVIVPRLVGPDAPAEKVRMTAAVLGVEEAGEALAIRVQAEIDAAMRMLDDANSRPVVAFVFVASERATLMFGADSLGSGVLEAAGAQSAGELAGMRGTMPFTPEALASTQPEYIITGARMFDNVGGMGGMLDMPGVAVTPAGRNRNIVVIDDLLLLGYTPRFGQLLEELIPVLHPEVAAQG